MPQENDLIAVYNQVDQLLTHLDKRRPLDAKIGQAANDLNLALRVVQRALPSTVAAGMRELMEGDTVVELISRASTLKGLLQTHLYPTSANFA